MVPWLNLYPNKKAAQQLQAGFSDGFFIPFRFTRTPTLSDNLKSAHEFPEILRQKIDKEVELGRIAGPFQSLPFKNIKISPLGIIPKKEPEEASVTYASFDKAVELVRAAGPGTLLAKSDIESAFRLLPVHLVCLHLLGCKVDQHYYFDMCLPMGCSISCHAPFFLRQLCAPALGPAPPQFLGGFLVVCEHVPTDLFTVQVAHVLSEPYLWMSFADVYANFNVSSMNPAPIYIDQSARLCYFYYFELFSTFLDWVVRYETGSKSLIHYLNEFLFVSPRNSKLCSDLLEKFKSISHKFGVPLSPDKMEGPCNVLPFLGIEIDTNSMVFRLPKDKILKTQQMLKGFREVNQVTLQQMQALLGLLTFACRVMPVGRKFSRRLSLATKGAYQPGHRIRLTRSLKADLLVWQTFLQSYNGHTHAGVEGSLYNTQRSKYHLRVNMGLGSGIVEYYNDTAIFKGIVWRSVQKSGEDCRDKLWMI
ncbi:unnamed protein product [Ranitomeya imitator]|uniref:Reverse transcriptase domain-containing protein n=1 Tax=Ranitomeya imitator TaxID=111125 RepID=A0ABN9KY51_9NEOB|nr:unnamed protein product [Ranitomeya imitator]